MQPPGAGLTPLKRVPGAYEAKEEREIQGLTADVEADGADGGDSLEG